jgi:hypothetical protein
MVWTALLITAASLFGRAGLCTALAVARVQINGFLASVACRLGAGPCRLRSPPRDTTLLAWRRPADGTKQILSRDPRAG